MITQELKDRLIADYPKFEDMTHKERNVYCRL